MTVPVHLISVSQPAFAIKVQEGNDRCCLLYAIIVLAIQVSTCAIDKSIIEEGFKSVLELSAFGIDATVVAAQNKLKTSVPELRFT